MTIQHAATMALLVQNASNLSGVVHSLAEIMPCVREHAATGTMATNQHPVVVLFVTQLMHLSGLGMADLDVYGAAYRACKELAGE